MKAKIDKDGCLYVKAETELEAYALRKWGDENMNMVDDNVSVVNDNFIISYGLDDES